MTAQATGRLVQFDGQDCMVFDRTFDAPASSVWAAITEPHRLARWIGTWSGDPTSGSVQFRMTAEGDDVAPSTYEIHACEPPRLLAVRTKNDFGDWQLTLELTERDGRTTLSFRQVLDDPAAVESVGPGWDYYLDRLVAAETGGDPDTVDFERDYYPALAGHYRPGGAAWTGGASGVTGVTGVTGAAGSE